MMTDPTTNLYKIQSILDKYNNLSTNNITYRLMKPSDAKQIANIACNTYYQYEPLTKRLIDLYPSLLDRLHKEQTYWFTTQTTSIHIHNTSIVATINDSDDVEYVIGFIHSFPHTKEHNDISQLPDLVQLPMINMMYDLKSSWLQQYIKSQDNVLEIQDLAVMNEYTGQSIATNLVSICSDIAHILQYDGIITESSSISQNVFVKRDFKSINSINYDDYIYNDKKLFTNIKPFSKYFKQPAVHLMYKSLS